MTVEANAEISACGHENIGSLTGATMSEEDEVEGFSEGEDIMVEVSGANIFFDGIYGPEGLEDEVVVGGDYDIEIDENLDTKDYGVYEAVAEKDEMVSRVRAFAESFPLPGQISPQEVVAVDPRLAASRHSVEESKSGDVNQRAVCMKRKRDEKIDIKLSSFKKPRNGFSCPSFPFSYQEFEDFVSTSSKYLTADEVASQLETPTQTREGVENRNSQNQVSEMSKTELPGDNVCDSTLVSPVKVTKDSYWADMVIHAESPATLPSADTTTAWGNKVFNSRYKKLHSNVTKKGLRTNTLSGNHVPMTSTTDKHSPAELIMNFDSMQAIPSESKLNNIFRRFGTLRETETVIHYESGCARVVFKKSSDAEIAVSSARAFKILGPSVVKYELGYAPMSVMLLVEVENTTPEMKIIESQVRSEREYSQEQQMQPEVISERGREAEDMPALKMHSPVIAEGEHSLKEMSAQQLQSEVISERVHEAEDMSALQMHSEVATEREYSHEEIYAQPLQSSEAREYKTKDNPVQRMHSEQLDETHAAEVTPESEDCEGLDDVDIME